jgi:hypothetical protein
MRKRLNRAPRIAGVPVSKDTVSGLTRAAMDILTRQKADLTERERRYNICLKCPEKQHDRCGLCGCFLKTKTILANSECPIGKWRLPLLGEATIDDTCCAKADEECGDNPTQIT